jgi:hypothetical protein
MVDALAWKADQEAKAYKDASASNNDSTGANNTNNTNDNAVLSGEGTRNYFAAKFTKYKT